MRDLADGSLVKTLKKLRIWESGWPEWDWNVLNTDSLVTDSHVLYFCHNHNDDDANYLFVLDQDTLEIKRVQNDTGLHAKDFSHEFNEEQGRIVTRVVDEREHVLLGGRSVVCLQRDSFSLLDLSLPDPEQILNQRRTVTPNSLQMVNNRKIERFLQVAPDLCIFEVRCEVRMEQYHSLETISFTSQKLPRALESWFELNADREENECEFCGKKLSTRGSRKRHQRIRCPLRP